MAWMLNIASLDEYTINFDWLDGDPKRILPLDRYVDVGINPPPKPISAFCGRPIDATHLPTRIRPSGRRRQIQDIIGSPSGYIVSDKTREVVERLEPGVHAFYPVTFEWKTGEPEGGRYFWIIQQSIKGLHPDLIHPPYPGPNAFWDGLVKWKHPDGKAVFSAEKLGNAHAWADPQMDWHIFVSDALVDAFRQAGVIGIDPRLHIDVV